eukprot:750742-Hanusia_phi.AAC.1
MRLLTVENCAEKIHKQTIRACRNLVLRPSLVHVAEVDATPPPALGRSAAGTGCGSQPDEIARQTAVVVCAAVSCGLPVSDVAEFKAEVPRSDPQDVLLVWYELNKRAILLILSDSPSLHLMHISPLPSHPFSALLSSRLRHRPSALYEHIAIPRDAGWQA